MARIRKDKRTSGLDTSEPLVGNNTRIPLEWSNKLKAIADKESISGQIVRVSDLIRKAIYTVWIDSK